MGALAVIVYIAESGRKRGAREYAPDSASVWRMSRETAFSSANGYREKFIISVQITTSRISNLI